LFSRDDDDESLTDEADKKDEGHLDEDRQDDDNDYGHRDEDEGAVLPGPLSTNSSPDGQGSYTSSLNGRDRLSSPSASRSCDAASAKRRRKKTRNPHISPNKQRQLRQKQKEREEKRRCDVVSSPVSTAGSGSGAFPHPCPPVPAATEGIPTPASPPPSVPPIVNRAFEEDFGPLFNGTTNTHGAGRRPDTPVDASSVDEAAAFLLGAAMGGFNEGERGERVSRDSSVEAEQSVTAAPESQDEDMPDVPAQSGASLLTVATNDLAIAESPSNQLLAELQKNGDDATESTLSGQASPIIAGVSTPATTLNGVPGSRLAQCIGGESSPGSQVSPARGLECSKTSGTSEKDILNISFGRRLSLGPSCADVSERRNAGTGDNTIKVNGR